MLTSVDAIPAHGNVDKYSCQPGLLLTSVGAIKSVAVTGSRGNDSRAAAANFCLSCKVPDWSDVKDLQLVTRCTNTNGCNKRSLLAEREKQQQLWSNKIAFAATKIVVNSHICKWDLFFCTYKCLKLQRREIVSSLLQGRVDWQFSGSVLYSHGFRGIKSSASVTG